MIARAVAVRRQRRAAIGDIIQSPSRVITVISDEAIFIALRLVARFIVNEIRCCDGVRRRVERQAKDLLKLGLLRFRRNKIFSAAQIIIIKVSINTK